MLNLKNEFYRLFFQKSDNFFIQLFRYFFVGGLAFLVDFSALAFFTEVCGIHYIVSNSLSFILGLLTNYFISIYWVFTSSNFKSRKLEFLFFAAIGVVGLILNDFLLWFFTQKMEIYYLLSKIIATVVGFLWNFLARKYLLYK